MITVANVGQYCVVLHPHGVDIQRPLTSVEVAILRVLAKRQDINISGLANAVGCGYSWSYAMIYRLKSRGLVDVVQGNGSGLIIRPLATLLEIRE